MGTIFKNSKGKMAIVLAGTVIVILILVLVMMLVRRNSAASLRVVVAPASAEVVIDGEVYQNGTYTGLASGAKQAEIRAEGFVTERYSLELAADEMTKLYVCLEPVDAENFVATDEYVVNCAVAKEQEGEKEKAEYIARYPIVKVLPIVVEEYSEDGAEYVSFRVDGGKYESCAGEFCVKITDVSGGNRDRAAELVRKRGYNLDDYEVIYEEKSGGGKAW